MSKNGYYSMLDVSVDYDEYHNLNCFTVEMVKAKVIRLKNYLADNYGIVINVDNVCINEIEVNRTFPLDYKFEEYNRPLDTIFTNFPAVLRLKAENEYKKIEHGKNKINSRKIQTYSRKSGKKGIQVKCYSKTAELDETQKIILDREYMRFEITLLDSTKVKRCLKTNRLDDLTDSMIERYFDAFVQSNIWKVFWENEKTRLKQIKKILTKHQKSGSNIWIRKTVEEINNIERQQDGNIILFDVNELLSCVKGLNYSSKYAKHRAIISCENICKDAFPIYSTDCRRKYEEIISKLLGYDY